MDHIMETLKVLNVDGDILEPIKDLWMAGIHTHYSCSGHDERDDRELYIFFTYDESLLIKMIRAIRKLDDRIQKEVIQQDIDINLWLEDKLFYVPIASVEVSTDRIPGRMSHNMTLNIEDREDNLYSRIWYLEQLVKILVQDIQGV